MLLDRNLVQPCRLKQFAPIRRPFRAKAVRRNASKGPVVLDAPPVTKAVLFHVAQVNQRGVNPEIEEEVEAERVVDTEHSPKLNS